MKTLTIAAACLAGGVALGGTSGVVAAELITGKDIKNRSITGKDIKKGSVPANRLKASGNEVAMETVHGFAFTTTVTDLEPDWQAGPTMLELDSDKPANPTSFWHWHGDLAAVGGSCQVQLRVNGRPGGGIAGTSSSVFSTRAATTGQSSGKRQHTPLRVKLYYRGTASSCTIGSDDNPSQVNGIMADDDWNPPVK